MAIQCFSWSDLGYRKIESLPASGGGPSPADIANVLVRLGDCEVTPDKAWVRRRARRKGYPMSKSIEIVDVFDKDTVLDNERLAFVDRHAKSEWMKLEDHMTKFRAEYQTLIDVIAMSEKEEKPWQILYRLAQALAYVGPDNMRALLRTQIAPCFFRMNPGGRIVVLRYDASFDGFSAELRCLYAMAQVPLPEILKEGFRGIQTLQEWHMGSLTKLLPGLLDFFGFLFYPFVGSVGATLAGLAFVFLMDPAEKHEIAKFPRNWLAYPSTSGSFGKEKSDLTAILQDFHGPIHHRAAHSRFCHEQGFAAEDRLRLLRWYVDRLNRFFFELMDVANFTKERDPEGPIEPIFGYEHQLTVDRLFRKTLLAMSLDEAATGNLMAFDVADLFDTLSRRLGNTTQDTEFFKMLFNPAEAPTRIARSTEGIPAPFAAYFADVAATVYRKIEETVVASVWRTGKVTPNGILVRDRHLTSEAPMANSQFVAETMRAFRNAHHGYFTASDPANRPSRYLFLVNGNLPVEMSALPALWWLSYLADPGFVGWNHLPIGAFD